MKLNDSDMIYVAVMMLAPSMLYVLSQMFKGIVYLIESCKY